MNIEAGELVIATSPERVLVRIQRDGTIIYGPDYTPDEAARILWEAIARQRVDAAEREALVGHIEHVLIKLGEQDLRYEQCQLAAKAENATHDDAFQEERAAQQWNVYVHQVVELARGLALRLRGKPPGPPSPPEGTVLN
jgi:hypothetical protein